MVFILFLFGLKVFLFVFLVGFVGRIATLPPPRVSVLSSTVFTSVDILVEYEEEQTRTLLWQIGRWGFAECFAVWLQMFGMCTGKGWSVSLGLYGFLMEVRRGSLRHCTERGVLHATGRAIRDFTIYALVNVSGWLPFASGQGWMSGQSTSRAYSLGGVLLTPRMSSRPIHQRFLPPLSKRACCLRPLP